ncbi:MAG: FAD-dependent monooxygenase [Firmicutes bacterium]|nr:FAD-dependent monooxygenase [Bacillota bacterium]
MSSPEGVVIIGGGPVGLGLAVELGQRHIPVLLVERREAMHHIPKGQNLTQRTLEHFYFWGCVEALRKARLLPPGYPIGGITAYGNLLSRYWYAAPGREVVNDFYFQTNERLPQYLTEAVLRQRAQLLPTVRCLYGWRAVEIKAGPTGVAVAIEPMDNSEPVRWVTGQYLVGCDGAHSLVREAVGIGRRGPRFDQRMVLAVFRSRALHKHLARFPPRTTYRVLRPEFKGYWQFFGRVDVGEGWFFHAPAFPEAEKDSRAVVKILHQAAGFDFPAVMEHVGFWDLRVEVAEVYQEGRVFIAGDAAHSHPPYGGYGLNSGLEDVVNLGWKLAAALGGWAGPGLLASYSAERQPVFQETGDAIARAIAEDRKFLETYSPERDIAAFEAAWARMASNLPSPQAYEPHYEGSPLVWGPPGGRCGIYGQHLRTARPGHHLFPLALSSGRNVYEELGNFFTLVATGDPAPLTDWERAAQRLGIPLKVVWEPHPERLQSWANQWVLVRPDQYVAWAAEASPPDPATILARAVGHLTAQ